MYLVDTNILSEIIRQRPHLPLVRRLLSTDPALLFASEITRYELRFGAAIHPKSSEFWSKVESAISPLPIWLPIDDNVSVATADLQALLRKKGKPIEVADAFLAATASVHDLVLVTRNVRHFENVPALAIENWFSEV